MILKISEWQSSSGKWYAADTSMFSGWWEIPRMMEISLTDYVTLLIEKYHANIISFTSYSDNRNSLLQFNFNNYTEAHKFVLDVNRIARNKKYFVEKRGRIM